MDAVWVMRRAFNSNLNLTGSMLNSIAIKNSMQLLVRFDVAGESIVRVGHQDALPQEAVAGS